MNYEDVYIVMKKISGIRIDIREKIHTIAKQSDDEMVLDVLDLIVELQEHPDATVLDINLSSELYTFIIDIDGGDIHSNIKSWEQAIEVANQLASRKSAPSG